MAPKTLTVDKSVSDGAFRVFSFLALQNYQKGKKTNLVSTSTRELAGMYGKSHETVRTYLKELAERGHIEKLGKARGKATYRLTSPVFDYQVRVETAAGAAADVGSKQLPALRDKKRRCPKCKAVARIVSTSGICAACLEEWAGRTA